VAYDPKVVTIWEGFKEYFANHAVEIDYVLYSTYDAQVAANLSGAVDVAWNSPLAWVKSQIVSRGACRAIAMRDSDRDLATKIITRANSGLSTLADLKGKTLAVGASDSPQATLIPLGMVAESGVDPRHDCRVIYHNVMVGKHGDHVGGERDAAKALQRRWLLVLQMLLVSWTQITPYSSTKAPSIRERRACSLPLRISTIVISPRQPTCQNNA
jgi:ABC-type phosphate/phosphonate transport system substrate-binding protein